MQLTLWTYEGPPHIGAMRIATAMRDVHYVLHAPQGDTYADLLFTMIERLPRRPPVTYTTFQARDLGGDTAELFKTAARDAFERFAPKAMLVGSSCTAELIQDDPGGLALALNLPVPVVPLELPAYQRKENFGASETFYHLTRRLATATTQRSPLDGSRPARCNILGPTAMGFRHRDDVIEITRLIESLGASACGRAAQCLRGRHHSLGRGRLQRGALPRSRQHHRPVAAAPTPTALHPHRADWHGGHPRLHR